MAILDQDTIRALIDTHDLITGSPDIERALQPNGIDLTVAEIATFPRGANTNIVHGILAVENHDRMLPTPEPIAWNAGDDRPDWILLQPGTYHFRINETINLPNWLMARTLPRSSVLRMGARIHNAVWDAGYSGAGMGQLVVSRPIIIEKDARIIQMVFEQLVAATDGYDGVYQGEGIKITTFGTGTTHWLPDEHR